MVKKKYFCGLFVLIVGLLFLFACVPKCPPGQEFINGTCVELEKEKGFEFEEKKPEEKKVEEKIEKVEKKEELKDEETEEAVQKEDEVKEVVPENKTKEDTKPVVRSSKEILNDLKSVYENKVKSFEFDFGGKHYMVYKLSDASAGDLIKIGLDKADTIRNFKVDNETKSLVFYDVIYVDVKHENKSVSPVVAYCEGVFDKNALMDCVEEFMTDVPIELSYGLYKDKYEIMLPSEYLYSLFSEGVFVKRAEENKYSLKNRAVTVVETTQGKIYYFDSLLGLPLKIEFVKDGSPEVLVFDNLIANKLKFAEMNHRTASEIPPSERFY